MSDHPVKRKLRQAILPYCVSAQKLKWQPLFLTYGFYAYVHDFLAALVGAGIAPPLIGLFGDGQGGSEGARQITAAVAEFDNIPWYISVAFFAFLLWTILKVIVTRASGEKRAALAQSCRKEFRRLEARLQSELSQPNPMPALNEIEKEVRALVDRNIAEDAWPWRGPAKGIDEQVEKELDEISRRFEQNWTPVAEVDQI